MLSNMEIHSSASDVLVCLSTNPWRKSLIINETSLSRAHPQTHTLGRTPLDESSARRRPLYLTAHNTHNPLPGFEPAITGSERLKTHALDRTAAGRSVPQ